MLPTGGYYWVAGFPRWDPGGDESNFHCVEGTPLREGWAKPAMDLFLHRYTGSRYRWAVSEGRTGYLLAGGKSKSAAIRTAAEVLSRQGEVRFYLALADVIRETGVSPRWRDIIR